jgi:hypothetical protein
MVPVNPHKYLRDSYDAIASADGHSLSAGGAN